METIVETKEIEPEEQMKLETFPIIIWPNDNLNKTCSLVETFDKDLKQFCGSLLMTMVAQRGYGLSSIQVGDYRRVIISMLNSNPSVFVNPVITERFGEAKNWEGCLSIPGFRALVSRAEHVIVQYQDLNGEPQILDTRTLSFSQNYLTPACIQHETDHLDGVMFTKYLSSLKISLAKKQLLKYHRMKKRRR